MTVSAVDRTLHTEKSPLHFDVLKGGFSILSREDGEVRYQIDVKLMNDSGVLTDQKTARFWITARSSKIALEIIEAYAVQVKDLSPEEYTAFKATHRFICHSSVKHTKDKKGVLQGATVLTFRPNRAFSDIEKDHETELSKESLEELDKIAKFEEFEAAKQASESAAKYHLKLEGANNGQTAKGVSLTANVSGSPVASTSTD